MLLHRSIVLTALLPAAVQDEKLFASAVRRAAAWGADTIEFYAEEQNVKRWGGILREEGMRGVYLAALYQKRQGLDLSATEAAAACRNVDAAKRCIDAALQAGVGQVLLSGGKRPAQAQDLPRAWDKLAQGLRSLCRHADGRVKLTLEPGDSEVDAMQLAGPTLPTVAMVSDIRDEFPSFGLTMDTSHLAQLGEDPEASLLEAAACCDHVHFANCILKKGHPLYGDKHPCFDDPDGVFTRARLRELLAFVRQRFPQDTPLTVSLEIISAGGLEILDQVMQSEAWLFHSDSNRI